MRVNNEEGIRPPHLGLFIGEAPRAISEFGAYIAARPWLGRLPRGDGHPVMVLPGMAADDVSTRPLRACLRRLGYHVHGWRLGRNTGREGLGSKLRERLAQLHHQHACGISLVGWSLGGIYARELAKIDPEMVRFVVTLGSPFAGDARSSNVSRIYERLSGQKPTREGPSGALAEAPLVPSSAIYSRGDGIVAWQSCLERPGPQTENIRVCGSHCGLGHNPAVLYAVADRLAQTETDWRPFEAKGWVRGLFPQSDVAGAGGIV